VTGSRIKSRGNTASDSELLDTLLTTDGHKNNPRASYLKRKVDLVMIDLETAHSWNEHTENMISNLRNISVTLLLAYIGFLFSFTKDLSLIKGIYVPFPLLIIPIPFILQEIHKRTQHVFNRENIKQIIHILTITDEDEYYRKIDNYKIRNARIDLNSVKDDIKEWAHYCREGFLYPDTILWYIFMIPCSVIAFLFFYLNFFR
jgi:hypothetical protein